jgi:phosphoribosyl-ATP pyrophosphohydrolase/phosphoribosyl-AMP cyclohydrolase
MVKFDDRGLLPAIIQDVATGQVLTLAYMNEEALRRTLEGPDVWFYSRSRGSLWHKGETSGNYLKVREVLLDCDGDAIVVKAEPVGPACHTGQESCFHNPVTDARSLGKPERAQGPGVLGVLADIIESRKMAPPPGSYTAKLFEQGVPRIAQKVIEEAGEAAIAALTEPRERLAEETADAFYHALVLLSATGVPVEDLWKELQKRRK